MPAFHEPLRIALAAKGLGAFPDNPDPVVARVSSLLAPTYPHIIRASAADSLGGMPGLLSMRSLIPHLEDDAIGDIVRSSLFRLTGQDFEHQSHRWETWLVEQAANISRKTLTHTDFRNYLRTQKLLHPLDDPTLNPASFYGVDFRAHAALFILDVSGSMETDGRIGKLKAQMSNLLTAMQTKPEKLCYGILTFGENIKSCFPSRGIAANDAKSHKQAVRFIERLQADGGTPMCEALNHALTRMLPGGNIDTIYFLSDGTPRDGTPAYVLDLALKIHQEFQTRIHTISIGEEPAAGFDRPSLLQQIAEATRGTFTIPP